MTLMTHLALMGPYNFFLSNKMCCRNRTSPQFLKVENNILILFIGTAVSGPNTKHHILRSLLLPGVVRSSDTLSKSSLPKFQRALCLNFLLELKFFNLIRIRD